MFGASLADQDARVRWYARSLGREVDEMFVEAGVSGAKRLAQRPKGAALLAKLKPGDVVIATKLDRLFRSCSDALHVAEDLQARKVHLFIQDLGGDITGNGVAKLVFSILAAVAEMERTRISERVRSVKQHLTRTGHFTGGRLPAGYKMRDGKLVADPRWEKAVKTMKDLRRNGTAFRAIAAKLSEDGFSVTAATVYRIVNGRREIDHCSLGEMSGNAAHS
jgi:putative DNA-invertase from lambdoid prophage Rac